MTLVVGDSTHAPARQHDQILLCHLHRPIPKGCEAVYLGASAGHDKTAAMGNGGFADRRRIVISCLQ